MTASAGKGRLFEAGGLTITIAGPIRMALNVALPEQLDKGNVVTDVALVEAPALPASSERREPDREPGEPERDAEEDVYGENGEKKPYQTILLVPANHVPENRLARDRTGPSHRVRFAERLVMQPNEYEERFRRPAPSWHQILAANQTRNRYRLRKWRYLLAAAAITVVTLALEVASDRMALGHARRSGIDPLLTEFKKIPRAD